MQRKGMSGKALGGQTGMLCFLIVLAGALLGAGQQVPGHDRAGDRVSDDSDNCQSVADLLAALIAPEPHQETYSQKRPAPSAPGPDTLQTLPVKAGSEVSVPIRVSPAGAVALQFDLEYDGTVLDWQGASTAPQATRASKELTGHQIRTGLIRVVVFGYNLDRLPPGRVGEVRFRATQNAQRTALRAVRRVAVGADGQSLSTTIRAGEIVVTAERR